MATFLDVPRTYGARRLVGAVQRALAATAADQTPEIVVIGDSTLTPSSGGAGRYWEHAFQMALARRFGNLPGTHWVSPSTVTGLLMARGGNLNGGAPRYVAAAGAANQMPPVLGSTIAGLGHTGSEGAYQWAVKYEPDNHNVQQPLCCLQSGLLPASGLNLELLAAAAEGSSEATVVSLPTSTRFNGAYIGPTITVLATYTTAMGITAAPAPGHVLVKRQILGPFAASAEKIYPQAHVSASQAGARFDAIAARWRHPTNHQGFLLTSLSAGGYRSSSWFGSPRSGGTGNHGDCRDVLAALKPAIVIYALGGNDVYGDVAAAAVKENLSNPTGQPLDVGGTATYGLVGETMAAFRSGGADPVPVFIPPPFRPNDGHASYAARKAQHNLLAQVGYDLAQEWGGAFWNLHRLGYEAGWNESSEDWYGLTDKGTWAPATAYVVGDMVKSDLDSRHFKCAAAHTSAAADKPGFAAGQGANWALYWQPIRQWITNESTDYAHWSRFGSLWVAEAMAACLCEAIDPAAARLSSGVFKCP